MISCKWSNLFVQKPKKVMFTFSKRDMIVFREKLSPILKLLQMKQRINSLLKKDLKKRLYLFHLIFLLFIQPKIIVYFISEKTVAP